MGTIVIIHLFIDCIRGARECQIAYFLLTFGTVVGIDCQFGLGHVVYMPVNQSKP